MTGKPLVLVLTADMGAGHLEVAKQLSVALGYHGVGAETVHLSQLLPAGWGSGLTSFYRFMACHAQGLYEMVFRLSMCPRQDTSPSLLPLAIPAGRRLAALVGRLQPSLVLCNFHLCAQIAGRMRAVGALDVPVVSQLLDFYVHGMWAHPGVDANLLLHPVQADRLIAQGGKNPVVCGPLVRAAFHGAAEDHRRTEARRWLGLAPDQPCALIVAGSWGVGDIARTLSTVLATGDVVPVVVAGHNRRLRESLLRCCGPRSRAMVFGWVEQMERLVAAADVLVENAGGLTAMEAMAAGVPVVTYAPIAGHGRANATEMARAGVSLYARGPEELVALIRSLARSSELRHAVTRRARAMFGTGPAPVLAQWAKRRSTALPYLSPATPLRTSGSVTQLQ